MTPAAVVPPAAEPIAPLRGCCEPRAVGPSDGLRCLAAAPPNKSLRRSAPMGRVPPDAGGVTSPPGGPGSPALKNLPCSRSISVLLLPESLRPATGEMRGLGVGVEGMLPRCAYAGRDEAAAAEDGDDIEALDRR